MLKMKVRVCSVVFAEVWGTVRSKSSLYLYLSCICVGAHTPQRTPVVVGSLHSLCGSWESNSLNISGLVASTFIC